MRKLGQPEGASPMLHCRVTEEIRATLDRLAKRQKTTASNLVRRFIEEGIAREVKRG